MFGSFAEGVRFPGGAEGVVRVQENFESRVLLLNGRLHESARSSDRGVSALFFRGGRRGFAYATDCSAQGAQRAADEAMRNLLAIPGVLPAACAPAPALRARDAGGEPLAAGELYELARRIDGRVGALCPEASSRRVELVTLGSNRRLLTAGGTDLFSCSPRTNLYLTLSLPDGQGTASLRDSIGGRGFSPPVLSDGAALDAFILALREDLRLLRGAAALESGEYPCILDGCSGLLIHEAFGHIAEADSVLDGSALAGRLGEQIVSPAVSVTDFAREVCGREAPQPMLADDEGTPCTDAPILERGVLTGYLHSRATAEALGLAPTGNARAARFCDAPLVRMRNTALVPGTSSFSQLLDALQNGVCVRRVGGGQADQTGRFSLEVTFARRVRNGRLGEPLRGMICAGSSFRTLGRTGLVGDTLTLRHTGLCGKQGQTVPVGMDGPALMSTAFFSGR